MRAETVLVTGGGSGIGMGLAAAFHARGATVIIAGRTRDTLNAVAAKHPGMHIEILDVADVASVAALAERVATKHGSLSTLINNAGVQSLLDFRSAPLPVELISREIDINLKGVILVANAFLPMLSRQSSARLINIGSGLGYVPLAAAPIYSATKAAVHSFTISLRRQLAGGPVKVIEILPPVVETDLHRGQDRRPPRAMTLDVFVAAAMRGLDAGHEEIAVGLAKALRLGARVAPSAFLNIVNNARD